LAIEDVAYERIRAAIADGEMHPNERLVEAELSARFGASRSAVRTALVRLQQEGLVEHKRNHGAKVRLIGEDEATEIYETRAVLEGLAARKAAIAAKDDDVSALRSILLRIEKQLEAGDLTAASNVNAELHAEILRVGRHATAERLVAGLNTHLVRFHYRTIMQPDRPQKSLAEHRAIVDAIAAHDPQRAEELMRQHLGLVIDTLRLPLPTGNIS
jgi:DNA-binding GntR family transcriptional regulator